MAFQPPLPPLQQNQNQQILTNPAGFSRPPMFQTGYSNGTGQLPNQASEVRYPNAPGLSFPPASNNSVPQQWNRPPMPGQGLPLTSASQMSAPFSQPFNGISPRPVLVQATGQPQSGLANTPITSPTSSGKA